MARITIWGDFKANKVDRLSLSGDLTYLLNKSDINVVNFEAPIRSTGKPIRKSGPNILQDVDAPKWLERYGYNVISLANNHIMDYGVEGMKTTRNAFDKARVIGCGSWEEAYRVDVIESTDGLIIGFMACTHCEFGTLTDTTKHNEQGTAWAGSSLLERNIRLCKEENRCDILILIAHCGVEYMEQPLPEWRERYHRWIEMGADAVIASHPHVPQGWEIFRGKPICYSLGNFCFDKQGGKIPNNWYNSLCCVLDISKAGDITFTIRPIEFNAVTRHISDNNSKEFKAYLDHINDVLANENEYMTYVETFIAKLLPHYMCQFSRGGLVHNPISMGFIKGIAEGLLGRGFFKREHLLNNIQCESHRWAILRALRQKK